MPTDPQDIEDQHHIVESHYVLLPNHYVRFTVASYDTNQPLIIDPVLAYSTYLGGASTDSGNGIAVDSTGNAYVTGNTTSTNFPTQAPFQVANGDGGDGFVAKFAPTVLGSGGLIPALNQWGLLLLGLLLAWFGIKILGRSRAVGPNPSTKLRTGSFGRLCE